MFLPLAKNPAPEGTAKRCFPAIFDTIKTKSATDRVRAGIAQARKQGKPHGRPRSAAHKAPQVRELFDEGISKAEIARRLTIGRTSVRRILAGN